MEKCATDNNLDTKLEYMTVSCGFRRATAISSKYITDKELVNINRHRRKHKSLKSNRKNKKNILTPHQIKWEKTVNKICCDLGIQRYIIGLFINWSTVTREKNNERQHDFTKKTTLDQIWSSLTHILENKESKMIYTTELHDFLKHFNIPLDRLGNLVKYELRQPMTRQMIVTIKEHITQNFSSRQKKVIRYNLEKNTMVYDFCNTLNKAEQNKFISKIVFVTLFAVQNIYNSEINFDKKLLQYLEEINDDYPTFDTNVIYHECILHMNKYPENNNKKHILYDVKSNPMNYMNYMISFANGVEESGAEYNNMIKEALILYPSDKDERKEYVKNEINVRRLVKPPTNFTPLPIWKLQPATIVLAHTQMETLRGPKNVDPNNILKGFMDVNFINKLCRRNLSNEQQNMSWQVINIQTNGVQVNVLLGAISDFANLAKNVRSLDKKGYNLGNKKINVNNETRGVHSCTCNNNCLKKTKNLDKNIKLTCVDPGRSDVFSVCQIDLEKANDPKQIIEDGTFWNVSSNKYRHKTGNFNCNYQEHSRRTGEYLEYT